MHPIRKDENPSTVHAIHTTVQTTEVSPVSSLLKDIVHFVGAGPGNAELITVKGARLLGDADLVVYAGSLVDRELVETYAATADIVDSAGLTLAATTGIIASA